ncbi:hypothetical protein B0O99DRAFT_498846 [Bisporella sp. PMI_857]|nr:hypothetical protein B0O99DRAFT_498846 [Bisporella sp. PMI_857]
MPGLFAYLVVLCLWVMPTSAALLKFQNCLSNEYRNSIPLELQMVPKYLNAVFDTTDSDHMLNVTVWFNVTGSGPHEFLVSPGRDDPYWTSNQTNLGGKIVDVPDPDYNVATTLINKVNVVTYQPWAETAFFCSRAGEFGTQCPISPVFDSNATQVDLPAFGFSHKFFSSYAFTSFTATLLIKYGDRNATIIGCISSNITPDIGSRLDSILTYIPLVVLIMVGVATAFAAIYSPWGSVDIFRWTTNYGRDSDLLRLVTPGFGDCLQYLQFITLTGGLTLDYPGFYQPIVSKVSWASLMFNQSFVGTGPGYDSLVDGVYVTDAKYGMDILRQLIGMSHVTDVWAGMVIWLLVIIGAVLALIQLGFLLRLVSRVINKTHEEDLRSKNMPFSMGNVIRLVFNYFLLPAVALSMFQLVVATESRTYIVALAVVMLVFIVGFACWLFYIITTTRPKSVLFDDLPTVLLYGSLYNTYSDNAAPFALVPLVLTFVRGIAIGAVQPSGIAQLVILAICEVITVLTLHAFRPFSSPTSMNAYHTIFAILRGAIVLLMIAFSPSLGVTEGPKGWVGYAILLMHAIVLVFAFLLNAVQTIIEVAARMAGAGGDEITGATRGGLVKVFGMRQLSRRLPRGGASSRQSQLSGAAMLDSDRKSYMMDAGRMRSQSAGSTGVLLHRQSTGLESGVLDGYGVPPHIPGGPSSYTPTTPGEASTFSFLPSAASPSVLGRDRAPTLGFEQPPEAADPFYRPPRPRRPTLDNFSPATRTRGSWASNNQDNTNSELADLGEGPSISGRVTPVQQQTLEASGSPPDFRRPQADYTTREVDFYYGVRGPALNANVPGRRIKTGPADPTGPAASAAGWLKSFFGGKTKEKNKGFEVVRSARMPPGMQPPSGPPEAGVPEGLPVATAGIRNGPIDSEDESDENSPSDSAPAQQESSNLVSPQGSEDEYSDDEFEITRISDIPPILPGIEVGEDGIELPSRFPSKATSRGSRRAVARNLGDAPAVPSVPRKSSRRKSQSVDLTQTNTRFLQAHAPHPSIDSSRLPFERSNSGKQSTASAKSSITHLEDMNPQNASALGNLSADIRNDRPTSMGYVHQHNIRTVTPSDNREYLGSSAEVFDGQHSGASSMKNQRR